MELPIIAYVCREFFVLVASEFLHACDGEVPNREFHVGVTVGTGEYGMYALDHIRQKTKWCMENNIHVAWNKPHMSDYENYRTFYFRGERDAIYFKTVWG